MLKQYLSKIGKKINFLTIFAFLALFIVFIPSNALAADTLDPEMVKWIESAQDTITFVMLLINKVLWAILVIIGPLLDNSILFSSCIAKNADKVCTITMEDNLLGIWVQIRNIVNIVFVVILVFTALYNVIGRTEGEFVLKTMLPKIIIGLIAVNFSFLASKVVLDAANVVTTAVAAIPVNIKEDLAPANFPAYKEGLSDSVCKYFNAAKNSSIPLTADQINQWGLTGICQEDNGKFVAQFDTEFLNKFSGKNLAFIMTAEIAKLSRLKFVSTTVATKLGSTFDQVMNFLLDIAVNLGIIVIYAVSILALLAVAVARIVVLWLMIALSPLVVLIIIIPQIGQGLGETDLKSTFIQHAIAPIIMVGSLSIGFILLDSMANEAFNLSDGGMQKAMDGVVNGNFENMHLGDLLALIGGVMIIWTGIFGAASKTYAKFITEKLDSWTKGGATFLAKLPLYATPIPVTTTAKDGHAKSIPLMHGLKGLEGAWQGAEDKLGGTAALDASFKDTFLEDPDRAKNTLMKELGKSKNLADVTTKLPTLLLGAKLDEKGWNTAKETLAAVMKVAPTEEKDDIQQMIDAINNQATPEERIKALKKIKESGVTDKNVGDITAKQEEEKKEEPPKEAPKPEEKPKAEKPTGAVASTESATQPAGVVPAPQLGPSAPTAPAVVAPPPPVATAPETPGAPPAPTP